MLRRKKTIPRICVKIFAGAILGIILSHSAAYSMKKKFQLPESFKKNTSDTINKISAIHESMKQKKNLRDEYKKLLDAISDHCNEFAKLCCAYFEIKETVKDSVCNLSCFSKNDITFKTAFIQLALIELIIENHTKYEPEEGIERLNHLFDHSIETNKKIIKLVAEILKEIQRIEQTLHRK